MSSERSWVVSSRAPVSQAPPNPHPAAAITRNYRIRVPDDKWVLHDKDQTRESATKRRNCSDEGIKMIQDVGHARDCFSSLTKLNQEHGEDDPEGGDIQRELDRIGAHQGKTAAPRDGEEVKWALQFLEEEVKWAAFTGLNQEA
ncbi:hypothetical protein NDU88_004467 [Pleurodeles waltl]|uniref:Uncharacterized protein n=1 Tax=Pleurodeles waltl TaxID=8319 RepID=A0AAV7NJV6_PLEWA|nr:hypothetical protein NDU88_004467 [Pleurodeles waltl]